MRREMLFSIEVQRSNRCSSIPVCADLPSKRDADGSNKSIRRVPQREQSSSPSSLAVLHRWQKIFPRTLAITHPSKTESATAGTEMKHRISNLKSQILNLKSLNPSVPPC